MANAGRFGYASAGLGTEAHRRSCFTSPETLIPVSGSGPILKPHEPGLSPGSIHLHCVSAASGTDDLPLILQDRSFASDGSIEYGTDGLAIIYGARNDTVIVNGTIAPVAKVPPGLVRLRRRTTASHCARSHPWHPEELGLPAESRRSRTRVALSPTEDGGQRDTVGSLPFEVSYCERITTL
jgi:hypothetical protein